MKKQKFTRFAALGGLGNQFFCFFAGLSLSKKYGIPLQIDLNPYGFQNSPHDSNLGDLELPGNQIFIESGSSKLRSFFIRIARKIALHSSCSRFFINQTLGIYFSRSLGFDSRLDGIGSRRIVYGYFQTWRYFYEVKDNFRGSISLKIPSNWYLEKLDEILGSIPVVVHIRRGDYLEQKDSLGVLSSEYFKNVIESLPSIYCNREIWIFSDDIGGLERDFEDFLPKRVRMIDSTQANSATESLLLMSKGAVIVISNSTFSYWSAMLSDEGAQIYAPNKWYKNMEDPIDLIPPGWNLCQSLWVS